LNRRLTERIRFFNEFISRLPEGVLMDLEHLLVLLDVRHIRVIKVEASAYLIIVLHL
jgi:hypothetical protein